MPSSASPFSVADALLVSTNGYALHISRIYIALGVSLSRMKGVIVHAGSHGFISHELRGYRGSDWCYSLVLNKNWIRLYIRNPELSRRNILTDQFDATFPTRELTAEGSIALNIPDYETAQAVCDWFERA